ncbi:preprotein translocase subunit SecE [Spirulina sp. CS-785/01]|uniref:preprotein translocase subunit SecE n=1 Tax=Spirulina sp. CS-785/01 TaxID=3021716 RepID=UPI00233052FC|nr:preprotein translocase subunit SecE [Spirulina sp. CS-785/01]MDB9313152.1 preprotein translocase subunit SecE [Spirulina sp. CS-785/01]
MAKKNVTKQDTSGANSKKAKGNNKTSKANSEPETQGLAWLKTFLLESKEELSKVVWPSRQQLISESAAVILMVIVVATTISFVDKLFIWISGQVF